MIFRVQFKAFGSKDQFCDNALGLPQFGLMPRIDLLNIPLCSVFDIFWQYFLPPYKRYPNLNL
jgi:hypothetical protein